MQYSYPHLIFVLPTKPFEFHHVIYHLTNCYQHSKLSIGIIKNGKNKITIKLDNNYHFYLYHNHDNHVAMEAQQIIQDHVFDEDYSGSPLSPEQKLLLSQATERLEFYGDIDEDMAYFNEMLFILNQIEQSFDVVILDTA